MRVILLQIPQLLCVLIPCPFCVLFRSSCVWGVSSVFSVRSYCTAFRDMPHALCRVARDRPLHTLEYVKLFKSHVIRLSFKLSAVYAVTRLLTLFKGQTLGQAVGLYEVLCCKVQVSVEVLTSPVDRPLCRGHYYSTKRVKTCQHKFKSFS